MSAEFWITTAAIVLGPLAAVLITYALQSRAGVRQRRLDVFRSLMTTRRTPLSPERVKALNLVEIEFYGHKKVQEKFISLLNTYGDQLRWKSENRDVQEAVIQEVDDRTAELLGEMGRALGYRLENLDLLRGGYYPEAFSMLERQQLEVSEFLVGLSQGKKALPTSVVDVRYPNEILKQARETQSILDAAQKRETLE